MIETENLGKRFESFTAVQNLTLNVPAGQLLALLGPNGAGKTTTVRMIGAILKPTTGHARVNGYDVVTQADGVRRSIGILTEQPGLYTRMSGLEYLEFYGRLYGIPDKETRAKGKAMFERFYMAGAEERRLGTYSKGMRQKVGLIRSMLHDPAVLLLDEPYTGLDQDAAALLDELLREVAIGGRTVIMTTHDLRRGHALADRIAILSRGKIAFDAPCRDVNPDALPALYADTTGAATTR